MRGGEPQIPILPLRDSSLCQKSVIFEHTPRDRAAADRGTLGICDRLRVAGHPYHPGGRSGEVVEPRQLGRRSAPQNSDFLLANHLKVVRGAFLGGVGAMASSPAVEIVTVSGHLQVAHGPAAQRRWGGSS